MLRRCAVVVAVAVALGVADRQGVASSQELINAVVKGDKEWVARLLASGADVEERDGILRTPLCLAIDAGNREIVELLLASGADVQVRRNHGASTLHFAVVGGHKEIAELLLAHGIDVNVADNAAITPLHIAASLGMAKIVALLLAKGANVNAKTNEKPDEGDDDVDVGDTPLHLAALRERDWRALAQKDQMIYMSRGAGANVEAAAVLLANGADVNANNDKGKTPLSLATSKEMKNLLRKYGAK